VNKEDIEAQLALGKLNSKIALENEFEKLGPSLRSNIFRAISAMACMFFILWLHPEISEQPISILLLVLIVGVGGDIYRESARINKRMDTLYKLLKNDL
jgi:hypothetical protein